MQNLNSNLLKKASKRKVNIKDNILFTIVSLATLYGLIYALCMIITLIEFITL